MIGFDEYEEQRIRTFKKRSSNAVKKLVEVELMIDYMKVFFPPIFKLIEHANSDLQHGTKR